MTTDILPSDHPAYRAYTLFTDGEKGLGIIQQFYIEGFKYTYWGPLSNNYYTYIFHNPSFEDWWEENARPDNPIFEARKVMWALGIKAFKKEPWETKFY